MKRLALLLCLLAACDDVTAPTPSRIASSIPTDLFLVGGQSNARGPLGYQSFEALQAQQGTLTAWAAFAIRYRKLTGRRVAIVNSYRGGSGIVSVFDSVRGKWNYAWDERGVMFPQSVAMLDSALARPDHHFAGVLWMQGGADAQLIDKGVITKAQYQRSLVRMIARYRTVYGPVPFYIFKAGRPMSGDTPGFQAIRAAQSRAATNDPLTYIAFSRAVTFADRGLMLDELHYSIDGLHEAGRAGARFIANLD